MATVASHSQRKQFIYVLKIGILYKIGRSTNPMQRVRGMQLPHMPDALDVYEVADSKAVEKMLHEQFKDQREHGEWFLLSEQDYRLIAGLVEKAKANGPAKVYAIPLRGKP